MQLLRYLVIMDISPIPSESLRKGWIQTLERRQLDQRRLTVDMVGSIREIAHSLAGENRFTRQTRQRYSVAEHCVRGSRLLPSVFAGAFLLHELSEVYLPDVSGPFKGSVYVRVPVEGEPWRAVQVTGRPREFNVCRTITPGSDTDFESAACGVSGAVAETLVRALNAQRELIPWVELERQHTSTMLKALGLESIEPLIYCGETKRMDWAMLAAEKVALHDAEGAEAGDWALPYAPVKSALLDGGYEAWPADKAEREFIQRFHELFGTEHDEPRVLTP